ncbi:single-strand DNA endonuclease ASTE1 [Neosynchiropus ocellatus]
MGVHGLTTYVEGNNRLFSTVKLKDSRLVIDGNSLYFRLYFDHHLDQLHGGDYAAFAALLGEFFSALAACNIQPYVVLDGGIDPSNRKIATLQDRFKSKIKEAHLITQGRHGCVLPLLTRTVFTQVLKRRGIPVVQCPSEADWEIACLARQWNCPVLTADSDFYIFDLPGGYLPFKYFEWEKVKSQGSLFFIRTRCYSTSSLCQKFGGMNPELLPLLAVLAGNDYASPKDLQKLLARIAAYGVSRGGAKNKGASSIEHILTWLSTFSSSAEALAEVSSLMGQEERGGGLSSRLWEGMQEYNISCESSLARWFSGGRGAAGKQSPQFAQLPESLSRAAEQGCLAPLLVDAFVMRKVMLIAQVENSKLPSSHLCATPIRQAAYGILLKTSGQSPDMVNRDTARGKRGRGTPPQHAARDPAAPATQTQTFVEEYDRLDLSFKKNQVEARYLRSNLCVDTVSQAPLATRLGVILEVLNVKDSALALVPLNLRLATAVTRFWLQEAKPKPSQAHLEALLLGIVCAELTRISHVRGVCCADTDAIAAQALFRLGQAGRRPLNLVAAHAYSQWTACLWGSLHLNQLLLLPLPEPDVACLFNGRLVHGLLMCHQAGQAAGTLLTEGSYAWQLFYDMLSAAKNWSSTASPAFSYTENSGSGRGRGGGGRGGGGRGQEGGRGRGGNRRGRGGGRGGGAGRAAGGGQRASESINRFALLSMD